MRTALLITAKKWKEYRDTLSAINKKAADLMQDYVLTHGFFLDQDMIDYAYSLSTKYGEASGALAAELYDFLAGYWVQSESHKKTARESEIWRQRSMVMRNIKPAVIAETATYDEVAKTVVGTAKTSPSSIPNAIGRLVKQAGADTTLQNALRDGAEFAWIPSGDTCPFCIMLASLGWQKASKKAIKNGHAEHIHSNCDCAYAIRFSDQGGVAGYDPERYLEQYYAAGGDINAMRRERYAQNRELINGQKRAAYKKLHPVRGATDTGTEIVMSDGHRIPYGSRPGFNGMTREQAIQQAE